MTTVRVQAMILFVSAMAAASFLVLMVSGDLALAGAAAVAGHLCLSIRRALGVHP